MNILAIGAHFDDVELGCGGALAKHVNEGDSVYVYIATNSGYSNGNNEVVRTNEIALKEGKAAMNKLGAKLFCGDFNTLQVEFTERLNVQILRLVEENKIDLVYTHWLDDIHHDHRAVSSASLHSCRHVKRLLMYRSNWYHSTKEFRGNFYVDISDFWDIKKKIILTHHSEVERTRRKWVSFFRNEAENAGQKIGVQLAEVFEVVKWIT